VLTAPPASTGSELHAKKKPAGSESRRAVYDSNLLEDDAYALPAARLRQQQ